MRIEEVTTENIKDLDNGHIINLRKRANEIYVHHFKDKNVSEWKGLHKKVLMEKYIIIQQSAKERGIKFKVQWPLDEAANKSILKRVLWGIEMDNATEEVVSKAHVSIVGKFLEHPRDTQQIEVAMLDQFPLNDAIRRLVTNFIRKETGKNPSYLFPEGTGASTSHIPIFDVILRPRRELRRTEGIQVRGDSNDDSPVEAPTKSKCFNCEKSASWAYIHDDNHYVPSCQDHRLTARGHIEKEFESETIKVVPISKVKEEIKKIIDTLLSDEQIEEIEKGEKIEIGKPFPNEHAARLQNPANYDKFRRTKGGKLFGDAVTVPSNVSIIWGHPKGAPENRWIPQALRFPKDSYTVAQAKKWLKDNKIKVKLFEAATGKTEKKKKPDKKPGLPNYTFRKVNDDLQMVGGIVYEPGVLDSQGDFTDKKEIEKAMYEFMDKYVDSGMMINVMHKGKKYKFPIIESFIPEKNTEKGGQVVKAGSWWLMIKITDDKIWKEVKDGELTGFSMEGLASSTEK